VATDPAAVAGPAPPFAPAIAAAAPERRVHVVSNRELLISQLLRPQWWALPLAVAAPIAFFFSEYTVNFVAIASTVTAVIGVIQAPVRVLLADWSFTLGVAADGLRIRRGLLETRSQTVPAGRVQAVGVEWPMLWRGHGWVRARMDVAGLPAQENSRLREGTLLPVGDVPTARQVVAEVLPGFDLTSVAVYPVPRRARWLAPFRAGVLGYTLTGTAFASRDGLLTRRLVVVPYGRIQSIRVVQRPLQRLLRLASVHIDTAGNGLPAIAEHRRIAEIRPLVTELAERARAARRS
jgi:putative membrane protein